jgi:hypothetical protein
VSAISHGESIMDLLIPVDFTSEDEVNSLSWVLSLLKLQGEPQLLLAA